MEEQENAFGIKYKINENGSYRIKARKWNDKIFYNIPLRQKLVDGTVEEFDRQIRFSECEPPEDGDYIKILYGFESNYRNPRDKYNWITTIVVRRYEKVDPPEQVTQEAIEEYNQKMAESSEEIVITGDDLPF